MFRHFQEDTNHIIVFYHLKEHYRIIHCSHQVSAAATPLPKESNGRIESRHYHALMRLVNIAWLTDSWVMMLSETREKISSNWPPGPREMEIWALFILITNFDHPNKYLNWVLSFLQVQPADVFFRMGLCTHIAKVQPTCSLYILSSK